jgi:pimeloyl-ACP methyl ester carboxylesterase
MILRSTLLAFAPFATVMSPAAPIKTGYAPVNGLHLYYEIHGEARPGQVPLVLLHGGGDTIKTSFGHVLPLLARTRQVIAFEQQGFGHTADIPGKPFSFEQSADDTVALLAWLKIDRADICGFSNGGTIVLQVAIRYPGLVRRIVPISTCFSREAASPEFWAMFRNPRIEMMPQVLKDAYLKVAPQPENLQSFFDKCARRMLEFQDIPVEKIRAIAAPTLVINGDNDVVRPEHAVALMRLIPGAQVAILPGTGHMDLTSRVDLIVPMITTFLDAPAAK